MPAPNEPTPGRRRTALAAVLAGVLAVGLVVAWVLVDRSAGDDPQAPAAAPSAAPVDLTALSVQRAAFCDRLGATGLRAALGAPVTGSDEYRSGERVLLDQGVDDVSHEFGCTYRSATGARARVWVFAEPVTANEAARIGRGVRREPGCRPLDRPAFGRSPAGTACRATRTAGPPRQRVALRGLFGDAWLSCQVTGNEPRAEVVGRARTWCVRVATTLGTS